MFINKIVCSCLFPLPLGPPFSGTPFPDWVLVQALPRTSLMFVAAPLGLPAEFAELSVSEKAAAVDHHPGDPHSAVDHHPGGLHFDDHRLSDHYDDGHQELLASGQVYQVSYIF